MATTCTACDQGFSKGDVIAVCNICNDLYHANNTVEVLNDSGEKIGIKNCANLTASEVRVLELKKKKPVLVYRCPSCAASGNEDTTLREIVADLQQTLKTLTTFAEAYSQFNKNDYPVIRADISKLIDTTENLDTRLKNLEACNAVNRLTKLEEKDLDSRLSAIEALKLQDKVEFLENPNAARPSSSPGTIADNASAVQDVFGEINDRKRREKNLIIYNVSESKDIEQDVALVIDILSKIKIKTKITKNNLKRLGNFCEGKVRPLLLKMQSHQDVTTALINWKSIPPSVYLSADFTPLQRSTYKKLKLEALEFNNSNVNKSVKKVVKTINGNPQIATVKIKHVRTNSQSLSDSPRDTSKN